MTKRYGHGASSRTALSGLTASFREGLLTVVTGPSGSGKTTVLHLLAGLQLPDAGEIVVDGTAIERTSRDERALLRRAGVGIVAQELQLTEFLTARENVALALELRGTGPSDAATRSLETLDAVGLADVADRPVGQLSGGQRERVAIARAVAPGPRILLVDEPTARLDQANALATTSLFRRLARERGTAVICASHDPLLIEQADERLELET